MVSTVSLPIPVDGTLVPVRLLSIGSNEFGTPRPGKTIIVYTTMMALSGIETWETPDLRAGIGHVLLSAHKPVTANQLAEQLRKDQSNVKKEADRAGRLGLLTLCHDPPAPFAKGRRPRSAYILTSKQRSRARAELPKHVPPEPGVVGLLQRGQELVTAAAAPPHLDDLLHVLSEAEAVKEAAWLAMCGDELLFAFDGPDPVNPALALLALLGAARVPARRGTISQVSQTPDAVERAGALIEQSRATRLRRDTRLV
jgi:DNA-binding MarR family transcriptional regulator